MYKSRSFPSVRFTSFSLIFFAMTCFFSIDTFAQQSASSQTSDSVITPVTQANPVTPISRDVDPLLFNASESIGNHKKKYYKACSIFIYIKSLFQVNVIDMSTYKVSSCPSSEFGRVTAASVTAQLRTIAPITLVSMVGPYFQMMDENNSVIDSAYVSIGNLNFSPVMRAQLSLLNIFSKSFSQLERWATGNTNYNPIPSIRNAHYIWYVGSTVYRLIDPEGNQYVMIYFAPLNIDTIANEEQVTLKLSQLPNILRLPPGWSFEKKVLKRILTYTQIPFEGLAGGVVMDDLNNIYIKINDNLN